MVLAGSCKAQSFYIIYYFIIMDGEEMVGSDSFGLLRIVIFFTRGGAILFISLAVLQYVFVVLLSINILTCVTPAYLSVECHGQAEEVVVEDEEDDDEDDDDDDKDDDELDGELL